MLKKQYVFICFNIFCINTTIHTEYFISVKLPSIIQLYLIHYTTVFRAFLYKEAMIPWVSSNSIVNITSAYICICCAILNSNNKAVRIHVPHETSTLSTEDAGYISGRYLLN